VSTSALRAIASRFDLPGTCESVEAYGSGHIHETYVARFRDPAGRYLLQRLNRRVFADPVAVMDTVVRVSEHLRAKLAADGIADARRRSLSVVATRAGRSFHVDEDGETWRCFLFIEGTRSHDVVQGPGQAREAARAFGSFARMLQDLPPPALAVTIPGFRDLRGYYAALERAREVDSVGRAREADPELERAARRYAEVSRALAEAGHESLPPRIVHNDCKLNNLLFDEKSGEALCVIDLDTVMEESLPGDFGMLVRTCCCRAPEDSLDLDAMRIDRELLESLTVGFLEGVGPGLCEAELRGLAIAGAANALENGIRFLADHLSGDAYFRVHREAHNLHRARAQLHLAGLLLEQRPIAEGMIEAALRRGRA